MYILIVKVSLITSIQVCGIAASRFFFIISLAEVGKTTKQFYMKKYLLMIACVMCLLPACNNVKNNPEEPENPEQNSTLAKMDITDATTIFLAPASSHVNKVRGIATEENNLILYKITNNGIVQEVTYVDENGNELTEEYIPEELHMVQNSNYFFVKFRTKQYLVNKQTGAVYETSNIIIETTQYGNAYFANSPSVVVDKTGNMYYKYNRRVHKIDVSNVDAITDETITPETDAINVFTLSSDGELFYRYYSSDGYKYRLRSTGGRLIPCDLSSHDSRDDNIAFRGLDGKLHIFDRSSLQIITFLDYGNIESQQILTQEENNIQNTIYFLHYNGSTDRQPYIINLKDKILAIGTISQALVLDSKNSSDITGEIFNINNYMNISDLHYNQSYIYCCGESLGQFALVRINPYTYATDIIMQNTDYEIYSFVVQDDDTIIFSGLRLSDGKSIIASIDKKGTFTILDESLNTNSIILEKLQ